MCKYESPVPFIGRIWRPGDRLWTALGLWHHRTLNIVLLVQVLGRHLLGTKPLPETTLTYSRKQNQWNLNQSIKNSHLKMSSKWHPLCFNPQWVITEHRSCKGDPMAILTVKASLQESQLFGCSVGGVTYIIHRDCNMMEKVKPVFHGKKA